MSTLESKITITAIDHVTGIVKDINKSLQSIKSSVSGLGSAWSQVGVAASDFAGRIRNLALIGIGAGVSIFALTKHYASYAKELSLTSLRTGIAVDSLQKLQYAASLSGVGVDDLNVSLKFLNRSIAVAATNPTSQQAAAFYSMGISARNANGSLKDANSLILEISSKFAKATDAAKMTATAMALFGRQGTSLIPFLREGPEHIKAFEAELAKLGHVWTPEELKQGQLFEESFIKLKTAISGVSSVIAINLFPVIRPIIDYMKDWIVANKLWLADNIKRDVILLGNSLKSIWQHLKQIKDSIMPVVEALGGFKGIIGLLIGSYIARLVASFLNLGGALLNFAGGIFSFISSVVKSVIGLGKVLASIGWVALANPVVFYAIALGLIAFAIYELIKHWDELKPVMIKVWTTVQPFVEGFLNIITLGMYGAIKKLFTNWDTVKPYLVGLWGSLSSHASHFFGSIYNWVVKFTAPIQPYISAAWEGIKNVFVSVLNFILGLFGTNLDKVENKIKDVLSSLKKGIIDFANTIAAPFKAVFHFFENLYEKIFGVQKLFGGGANVVNPQHATGGIIKTVFGDAKELTKKVSQGIGSLLPSTLPTNVSFPNISQPSSLQAPSNFSFPGTSNKLDINMTIDYEGRPKNITSNAPPGISFTASLGKMV